MSKKIKWGIIGLGKIARKFADDLQLVANNELVAVASRSVERSKTFAEHYHVKKYYGSYDEILQDDEVEVIYIATPHTGHYENTLKCLEHGKAVLCEKAFAMNLSQVEEMVAKAKEKQLFLMEALWTRFSPSMLKVIGLVESGAIGNIRSIQADFGFNTSFNPDSRLFNKQLGGGSLLDVGIYPVFLASTLLGVPASIVAKATFGKTGVDEDLAMLFQYESGALGILSSSLTSNTGVQARINGDQGSIKIHSRWHETVPITLEKSKNHSETFNFSALGWGYTYEIEEVAKCLTEGKLQSDLMSHEDSLRLMSILDRVREHIGLKYS